METRQKFYEQLLAASMMHCSWSFERCLELLIGSPDDFKIPTHFWCYVLSVREGKAERREVGAGDLRLSSVGQCVPAVCSSKNGSKSAKICEQSLDSNSILPLIFMLRSSSPIRLDVTVKLCQSDLPKKSPHIKWAGQNISLQCKADTIPVFYWKGSKEKLK